MPLPDRWLTSLLYRFGGGMILVDCGEGTQIPIKLAGWGFKAIDAICFTHFHADHVAGLPGLLLTIGNSGRTWPLTLYGPPGIKEVVRCLTVISPQLPYPVMVGELPDDRTAAFEIGGVKVSTLPGNHWVPCLSYTFAIERAGRFDAGRASKAGIPVKFWKPLQRGENVEADGVSYTPDMVLGPPRRGIKVGYCTDTRPTRALPGFMEDCDLLVCEGLYGDPELSEKAAQKGHMVFAEAARVAKESKSRELWLTHYSPALKDPGQFLPAAAAIFENTRAGGDLMKAELNFPD